MPAPPCCHRHAFDSDNPSLWRTQETEGITYSIVRPTAFFKSIAGQVRPTNAEMSAARKLAARFDAFHLTIATVHQRFWKLRLPQCSRAKEARCSSGAGRWLGPESQGGTPMQVATVKGGKPYVMFGDGTLAACKPISEADLASFIADCVQGEDRVNQVLPIGGVHLPRPAPNPC